MHLTRILPLIIREQAAAAKINQPEPAVRHEDIVPGAYVRVNQSGPIEQPHRRPQDQGAVAVSLRLSWFRREKPVKMDAWHVVHYEDASGGDLGVGAGDREIGITGEQLSRSIELTGLVFV